MFDEPVSDAETPKVEFKPEKFTVEVERPVARFELREWEANAAIAKHVRSILSNKDIARVQSVTVQPNINWENQAFLGFDVVVTLKGGA